MRNRTVAVLPVMVTLVGILGGLGWRRHGDRVYLVGWDKPGASSPSESARETEQ